MKTSDKKKLDFYKIEYSKLERGLVLALTHNEILIREQQVLKGYRENWQAKYEDLLTDSEEISKVITKKNVEIIAQRELIADQALQIHNLEKGFKEVDTGHGILSIIFKGKK